MGVGRAVRFLQQSVGCNADGDFGPASRQAVAVCDVRATITKYCDTREAFYRTLASSKPKLEVFLKGWLNRLGALRREVGLPGLRSAVALDFGDTGYVAKIPDIGEHPDYDW